MELKGQEILSMKMHTSRDDNSGEFQTQGRIQGGGTHPARAPPKIGKNMIFWRKIVIFHTKYPNNFRASLRSAQMFEVRPPNLKFWIRP